MELVAIKVDNTPERQNTLGKNIEKMITIILFNIFL